MTTPPTIIKTIELEAGYDDVVILKNVNFDVLTGTIHGILGGSGCGKSTLLNHLIGVNPIHQGKVFFLDQEIDSTHPFPDELRTKMGVLFQNGALLSSLTVAENIALPIIVPNPHTNKSELDDLVQEKLKSVQLENAGNKFPSELSGGMRKRAALARALIRNPQILFCDEPSAGLDPSTARHLDDLFLSLREQGITIVIVTHELPSIHAICNRITFLAEGTSLTTGTLADTQNNPHPTIQSFFLRRPSP